MNIYDLSGCRAVIFRPNMPLKDWLADQKEKPFALIDASLFNGTYFIGPKTPIGTVIENGKMVHNDGGGFGFGYDSKGWYFGGPWDHTYTDYITGFTGIVQNGKLVPPTFSNAVFTAVTTRIGIGEKNGALCVVTDDGVNITNYGAHAVANGVNHLVNLDGGGSRYLYYNGKTIYTSIRIPYNAIAFYRTDGTKKEEQKMKICIDPGHGGTDNTNGAEKYREHVFTLQLGMKIKAELEYCGLDVLMTREADKTVELRERSDIANNAGADLFVSLHSNASSALETRGMCIYTSTNASATSNALAEKIIAQLESAGVRTFGTKHYKKNFSVVYYTNMPAVLVEYGFHTNAEDRALLASDEYQDKLAIATAKAICAQVGVEYKAAAKPVETPSAQPVAQKCRIEIDVASKSVANTLARELIEKGYNPIVLQYVT